MIKQRRITIVKGAKECQLSYRQMLRVYQKYILEGDAGLIFGPRGRASNRKLKLSPRNYKHIFRKI